MSVQAGNVAGATSPEGPRLKHFRQAMQKMLQASIKQCTSVEKVEQTFPFNLAPAQLSRIEEVLLSEFTATTEVIKTNFEKTLEMHELPPKLNQVDSALRALPPNSPVEARKDISPDQLLQATLAPTKRETIQKLRIVLKKLKHDNDLMQDENNQRQAVLDNRISNVKATRGKFAEAFSQSSDVSVGEIEVMIDRMAHQQTVPLKPVSS